MLNDRVALPSIAYFPMEIALQSHIPTYSGGLGILAGDTLRSAADLGLPTPLAPRSSTRSGCSRSMSRMPIGGSRLPPDTRRYEMK
jgi:hypothetical protein